MTDKNIKRFQYDIQVKDSGDFLKQYDSLIKTFTGMMRDEGYVRILDLDPYHQVEYDESKDVFNYVLTLQAVYVGRKQAACTEAMVNGKLLPRSTRETK